jgi:hypothetical protein
MYAKISNFVDAMQRARDFPRVFLQTIDQHRQYFAENKFMRANMRVAIFMQLRTIC